MTKTPDDFKDNDDVSDLPHTGVAAMLIGAGILGSGLVMRRWVINGR